MPIVSIIIPIYNVESYIRQCLQSVMNQTLTEGVECILVDDCGQDMSMNIAQKMVDEYHGNINFHILHHDNTKGLSEARNTGIKAAKGEYIYFLSGKDYLEDEFISVVRKESDNKDIVSFGYTLEDKNRILYKKYFLSFETIRWESLKDRSQYICSDLLKSNYCWETNSYIFRRDLVEDYHHRLSKKTNGHVEDFSFYLLCLLKSKSYKHTLKVLLHHTIINSKANDALCSENKLQIVVSQCVSVNQFVSELFLKEEITRYCPALYYELIINLGGIDNNTKNKEFIIKTLSIEEYCFLKSWLNRYYYSKTLFKRSDIYQASATNYLISTLLNKTKFGIEINHLFVFVSSVLFKIRIKWIPKKWKIMSLAKQEASMLISEQNISVFSNNCVGPMVSHDFYLRHNSPCVNIGCSPKDYIKLLKDIDKLEFDELVEIQNFCFPMGRLKNIGIEILFGHYKDFESAKSKWEERVQRINKNNIYAILVERDGCTLEDIRDFDSLKLKKKLIISHKRHKGIKNEVVINGYEDNNKVGAITDFEDYGYFHIYDRINWFDFFGVSKYKMILKGVTRKLWQKMFQ